MHPCSQEFDRSERTSGAALRVYQMYHAAKPVPRRFSQRVHYSIRSCQRKPVFTS